jgi:hypothetical protein
LARFQEKALCWTIFHGKPLFGPGFQRSLCSFARFSLNCSLV